MRQRVDIGEQFGMRREPQVRVLGEHLAQGIVRREFAHNSTLAAVQLAFEAAGVIFINSNGEGAGVRLNFTPIDPIRALYWSAVINAVVAVPVMVLPMLVTAQTRIMGEFALRGWLRLLGWASTAAMAVVRCWHGDQLVRLNRRRAPIALR
jgi:Mn2+/Fe2+ NRAMP family transporter